MPRSTVHTGILKVFVCGGFVRSPRLLTENRKSVFPVVFFVLRFFPDRKPTFFVLRFWLRKTHRNRPTVRRFFSLFPLCSVCLKPLGRNRLTFRCRNEWRTDQSFFCFRFTSLLRVLFLVFSRFFFFFFHYFSYVFFFVSPKFVFQLLAFDVLHLF